MSEQVYIVINTATGTYTVCDTNEDAQKQILTLINNGYDLVDDIAAFKATPLEIKVVCQLEEKE